MPVAVLAAAALDVLAGEPPARAHPVVWAGHYLDRVGRRLPVSPPGRAVVLGGGAWGMGAVAAVAAGVAVDRVLRTTPAALRRSLTGVALWPLASGRLLLGEVEAVDQAVTRNLDEGRTVLGRIVSRDTGQLDVDEVRAAAVESLAENLSDSVVAPLFWFCVGGLPAAALYRFANTADAMWGYRSPRWEHPGKVAARADDVLSFVPARLTAVLLMQGAGVEARRRTRTEARKVPSPNAGWPMAALAVRLDLRLPKSGSYVLNPSGSTPGQGDLRAALATVRSAMLASVIGAACAAPLVRSVRHRIRGAS